MYIYNITKVHSLSETRQTTRMTEVLFGNSLSWLLNNTCILYVCWIGLKY